MAPQLAWIGLGNMGRGMCKNLVEKGNLSKPLIIYNRTAQRAHDLSTKIGHSTVADSISSAVSKSDIIFLCLGDDAAVKETFETILQSDIKGKIIVDCSTVHPDLTTTISQAVEAHSASFVACPVFGAPAMADSGKLICVLAGPASVTEQIKPYCTGVIGRAMIDLSDKPPSKATLLKIHGNTFIFSMIETIAEGHVLAEKTGLGTDVLHSYLEAMFPGPYVAYSDRMLSGDYHTRQEPLFAIDLARKDARHASAIAAAAGMRMANVELADTYMKGVKDHLGKKGDVAAIYGAKRVESGLKFENN